MESDYYKIVLWICIVDSCLFQSMDHTCDRNGLIQWTMIKLSRLLVISSHWLDQTSIVQDNLHLQWCRDQRIPLFLIKRSHLSNQNITRYFWNSLHTHSGYTGMDSKLLNNSKISSIILMLPEIRFLSPIKTSSVFVTVTCSLARVTILKRVSINIIPHLYLKLFIKNEYKAGTSVDPNRMKRNVYFWLSIANKANFSLSTRKAKIWWYPCLLYRLTIHIIVDPAPTVLIASSQREIGN